MKSAIFLIVLTPTSTSMEMNRGNFRELKEYFRDLPESGPLQSPINTLHDFTLTRHAMDRPDRPDPWGKLALICMGEFERSQGSSKFAQRSRWAGYFPQHYSDEVLELSRYCTYACSSRRTRQRSGSRPRQMAAPRASNVVQTQFKQLIYQE
jgi:hypothetical protein